MQTKSPKIAFVAYGVAASADACQAGASALAEAGYSVVYTDFKVSYPGTTVATDVQRMKQAGANMIVSCMDVQGNITMARAIQQYGLKATQLWFSGNDQSTLNSNQSLMQGVYFDIAHVPYTAPTSVYPGLKLYLTQMKKYEPKYVNDEIAIQGWESAALFVQGVKLAGNNLTQANVIKADNSLTAFTAGGLTAPVNWKSAGHTGHAPPYCGAYIKTVGKQVRADAEQGQERVRLLPVDQPEQAARLPAPGRHARPRPDRRAGLGPGLERTRATGHDNGALSSDFAAPGVQQGCAYALVGICLVLTYQATGCLQLRLRRAGLRLGLRLHLPDPGPQLAGVRGLPGLGGGHGAVDRLCLRPACCSATSRTPTRWPRWSAAWPCWSGSRPFCP